MIKDGQIEMLQKIITTKYHSKGLSSEELNSNSGNNDSNNVLEELLYQKDLEINELLEKIN